MTEHPLTDTTRDLIQRLARQLDLYRQMVLDDCTLTHPLADEARAYLSQPEPEGLPPDYIDSEHTGHDREMLEEFYRACRSEGGSADEIHLRGLKAVIALAQPDPEEAASNHHTGGQLMTNPITLNEDELVELKEQLGEIYELWDSSGSSLRECYASSVIGKLMRVTTTGADQMTEEQHHKNVGSVEGNVKDSVGGTIAGRAWKLIETPEEKFRRLLDETENQELIDAFKSFKCLNKF